MRVYSGLNLGGNWFLNLMILKISKHFLDEDGVFYQ